MSQQQLLLKLPEWGLGIGRNTWTKVTTTVIGPALHEVGKKHERKPMLFNYILQTFVLKFYAPWDPPDQTQGRVSNTGVENKEWEQPLLFSSSHQLNRSSSKKWWHLSRSASQLRNKVGLNLGLPLRSSPRIMQHRWAEKDLLCSPKYMRVHP